MKTEKSKSETKTLFIPKLKFTYVRNKTVREIYSARFACNAMNASLSTLQYNTEKAAFERALKAIEELVDFAMFLTPTTSKSEFTVISNLRCCGNCQFLSESWDTENFREQLKAHCSTSSICINFSFKK